MDIQRLRDSWEQILKESRFVEQEMALPPVLSEKRYSPPVGISDQQLTAEHMFNTDVIYRVSDLLLLELEDRFKAANSFSDIFSPVLKYNSLDEQELKSKYCSS